MQLIVEKMDPIPWQGVVTLRKEGGVYINAGTLAGIKLGDKFDVLSKGAELTDPETGLSLGFDVEKTGTIKVSKVDEKFSLAQVTAGEGGNKGDLVRLPTSDRIAGQTKATSRPTTGLPRVVVAIPEVDEAGKRTSGLTSETEVTRKLTENGYTVVDQEAVMEFLADKDIKEDAGSFDFIRTLNQRFGADLVILGEASGDESGKTLGYSRGDEATLVSCRARVEARCIDAKTGNVLIASSSDGSGVDISETSARKKALQVAAGELADSIVKGLSVRLPAEKPSAGMVKITITNIGFDQLDEFERKLRNVAGITDVETYAFSDNTAQLGVATANKVVALGKQICEVELDGCQLEITGLENDGVDVEVRQRDALEESRSMMRSTPEEVEPTAWLGISARSLAAGGVIVEDVESGGPADHAGVESGDIILDVGKIRVGGLSDYNRAIRQFQGTSRAVLFRINRGGKVLYIAIKPGLRTTDR